MTPVSDSINLLAIGSWEYHGPHLSMDTDTRLAVTLANLLYDLIDANAGLFGDLPLRVLPPLGASCSQARDRSISLRPATLLAVLDDMASQCSGPLVLVNMQSDNKVLESWVRDRNRAGFNTLWFPRDWSWQTACEAAGVESPAGTDGQGGEVETSLAMAFLPDLVKLDRIPGAYLPSAEDRRLWGVTGIQTPDGVVGRPALASADKGQRLAESLVQQALAELQRMLAAR
jgi:creatinine amidohydrolase